MTKKTKDDSSISVRLDISEEMIKGILCCAFEGGSNYWYMIEDYKYGPGIKEKDFLEGGKFQGKTYWHSAELVPLVKGCAVLISDKLGKDAKKRYVLDREAIMKGLKVMAEKEPKHFGDMISEHDDATTGDVFLQCCLFGEVVYG